MIACVTASVARHHPPPPPPPPLTFHVNWEECVRVNTAERDAGVSAACEGLDLWSWWGCWWRWWWWVLLSWPPITGVREVPSGPRSPGEAPGSFGGWPRRAPVCHAPREQRKTQTIAAVQIPIWKPHCHLFLMRSPLVRYAPRFVTAPWGGGEDFQGLAASLWS